MTVQDASAQPRTSARDKKTTVIKRKRTPRRRKTAVAVVASDRLVAPSTAQLRQVYTQLQTQPDEVSWWDRTIGFFASVFGVEGGDVKEALVRVGLLLTGAVLNTAQKALLRKIEATLRKHV